MTKPNPWAKRRMDGALEAIGKRKGLRAFSLTADVFFNEDGLNDRGSQVECLGEGSVNEMILLTSDIVSSVAKSAHQNYPDIKAEDFVADIARAAALQLKLTNNHA